MDVRDLELEYNIPVKVVLDFFKFQNRTAYIGIPITKEQFELFQNNIDVIKANVLIENIEPPKLKGPTIIGKLELNEQNIPRCLAAIKEFNISLSILFDFLASKGFNINNLSPSSRLSLGMYNALKSEYSFEKKSSSIDVPTGMKAPPLSVLPINITEDEIFPLEINDTFSEIKNQINEKVICVLKKNATGTVELDYVNIEQPFQQYLIKLKELCSNSKSTLNDLKDFITQNPILNQLSGHYTYCQTLYAPFQGFIAYPENTLQRIKDRQAYIFQTNQAVNDFNEEKNVQEFKNELWHDYNLWAKALAIQQSYIKCQQNGKFLIYSHRIIGWSNPVYSLTPNFSIEVKTNFGYGRSSYFFTILRYKNIEISVFSEWIYYQYADYADIIRYTRQHDLSNNSWLDALSYCKEACNISLSDEQLFISKYIIEECEKMTEGLEEILNKESFRFKNKEHNFYEVDKQGRVLIEYRGEKITGALNFIHKILQFQNILLINTFVKRIEECNRSIEPILITESGIIKKELKDFNSQMVIIEPIYFEQKKQDDFFQIQKNELKEQMMPNGPDLVGYSEEDVDKEFITHYPEYSEFETEFVKLKLRYTILKQQIENNQKALANILSYIKNISAYFKAN